MPKTTLGAVAAEIPKGYTHVYKHSSGNRDWMIMGKYIPPTATRSPGTWEALAEPQMIDAGGLYASKDYVDATGRRITTGFGHCPGSDGGLVLPREITYHPELDQLVFTPLPELAALRSTILANLTNTHLTPNAPTAITTSNRTDVLVAFEIPESSAGAVTFGVSVSAALSFYVNYTAKTNASAPFHEVEIGMGGEHGNMHAAPGPTLRLSPHDTEVNLRVFIDGEFVECKFSSQAALQFLVISGPIMRDHL